MPMQKTRFWVQVGFRVEPPGKKASLKNSKLNMYGHQLERF